MPRIVPVHYRALIKIFSKKGYSISRREGSHVVMNKPDALRPVVIPTYSAVGVPIIKSNLRSAGISNKEYSELLADP
jgi:predicted RNA binding protein YcfA (HicA-like mRNA interferase family)